MVHHSDIQFSDILALGKCPHCEEPLKDNAQPGDMCGKCGEMYFDLIEHYYAQPPALKEIMDGIMERLDEDEEDPYKVCGDAFKAVQAIGYTLDYDLSGTLFGLKLEDPELANAADEAFHAKPLISKEPSEAPVALIPHEPMEAPQSGIGVFKRFGYAQEQRLRFIDSMLKYYGHVGRNEVIDFFGVGSACATRDFKLYKEVAPGNMLYNGETKRYVRSEIFKRVYL